ncbi:MAG: hypothetical protein R8M46_06395 [Ghiorsea sp.]
MIRMIFALIVVIAIFTGLVLFPEIANQRVRIEMLGWLFETRTGMFIILLVTVLSSLWFLQKVFNLSINSPKQLWSNLRSGNKKRRELRLQEALATWIDEGEGNSQKLLKRSKNIAPNWLHDALTIWWNKPASHPKINDEKDTPLSIALKARLATNSDNLANITLSERQHYLDTWLAVHPAAPIALQRKAVLLGELGEYSEQVTLLEELWNKKKNVLTIKPLLATALHNFANQKPENALGYLRKANSINPHDADVLIDLCLALNSAGDSQSSSRLLLDYIEAHDCFKAAEIALDILSNEPLKNFKLVDKPSLQKSNAGSWLRLNLAHQAELTGIAEDGLSALLESSPSSKLWQLRGDWYAEKQKWQQASQAYQQANKLT